MLGKGGERARETCLQSKDHPTKVNKNGYCKVVSLNGNLKAIKRSRNKVTQNCYSKMNGSCAL